jgi:medium-chain acyl-[acyl-carrier-protein] hydrolase
VRSEELWFSPKKPAPGVRLRLFCIPYAGGGPSVFRSWRTELPEDIDVCPIQFPGRENRVTERRFMSITLLVKALAENLEDYLEIPFAIFGHSTGALIGFELARELRRRYGVEPAHLFASACRSPQTPNPYPTIHLLPEQGFLLELNRLYGQPDILQHPELKDLLIPTIRADIALYETYCYTVDEPLRCPISALGGLQDRSVLYQDLRSWRIHTQGAFAVRTFPGGHLFIHSARPLLLRVISQIVR